SQPLSIVVEFNNQYKNIVVLLLEDKVIAFENSCPHQHRPSLHMGYVENDCIVCPEHGWSFDLNTGSSVNNRLSVSKLRFVDICIFDGIVFIDVDHIRNSRWNFT
ncbi:MAG: Rieske (2Fe-2S) protein, partial [Candidatus Kapaibacteriota bacterium]